VEELRIKLIPTFLLCSLLNLAFIPYPAFTAGKPSPFFEQINQGKESKFLLKIAKELSDFADYCASKGWFRKATAIRREILRDYSPNDPKVRKALGYRSTGDRWIDEGFSSPPDFAKARMKRRIEKRWLKLCSKLHDIHKRFALQLQKRGNLSRVRFHFDKALRFGPNDSEIAQLQKLARFEDFFGSPLEVAIVRRLRGIAQILKVIKEIEFPVEPLPENKDHTLVKRTLGALGVPYRAFKSTHFRVFGDLDPETLKEGLRNAERAYHMMRWILLGYGGFHSQAAVGYDFAIFKTRRDWSALVRAGIRNPGQRKFILTHSSSTDVGRPGSRIWAAHRTQSEGVFDTMARKVGVTMAGLKSQALSEGLGHAVVGLLFGKTLSYTVGRRNPQGTRAGGKKRPPIKADLETWKDLISELAWKKMGMPAQRLTLMKVADMGDEERVKAWSLTLYFLRRNPGLLLALDVHRFRKFRNLRKPSDVSEAFSQLTRGKNLGQVEEEWRRYLTDPDRLSVHQEEVWNPNSSLPTSLEERLVEWNRWRLLNDWLFLPWADLCNSEVKELLKEKAGLGIVQRGGPPEEIGAKSKRFLSLGSPFFWKVMVFPLKGSPKSWLSNSLSFPGYRDDLCNQKSGFLPIYSWKKWAAIEKPLDQKGHSARTSTPNRFWASIPSSLPLDRCGPWIRQRIRSTPNREKANRMGFPIALHHFGPFPKGFLKPACTVTTGGGRSIEGFLLKPSKSSFDHRFFAEGMLTFIPFDPLPSKTEIIVRWSFIPFKGAAPFIMRRSFKTK
jgi:hypothetical protein